MSSLLPVKMSASNCILICFDFASSDYRFLAASSKASYSWVLIALSSALSVWSSNDVICIYESVVTSVVKISLFRGFTSSCWNSFVKALLG
jgi:hypothetical protein